MATRTHVRRITQYIHYVKNTLIIIRRYVSNDCRINPSITSNRSVVLGARCSSVVRMFAHGAMGRRIDPSWGGGHALKIYDIYKCIAKCLPVWYPLSYFSFQPVLHDWCNKGRGMCYPVCGTVHIK